MVMFATIFFKATFLTEWFLSFFPPLFNSRRSSATLPCCLIRELLSTCVPPGGKYAKYMVGRAPASGTCSPEWVGEQFGHRKGKQMMATVINVDKGVVEEKMAV